MINNVKTVIIFCGLLLGCNGLEEDTSQEETLQPTYDGQVLVPLPPMISNEGKKH